MNAKAPVTVDDVEDMLLRAGYEKTQYMRPLGQVWEHKETKRHITVPFPHGQRYFPTMLEELEERIGAIEAGQAEYGTSRWNVGDENANRQRLIEKSFQGNNSGTLWRLECSECHRGYGANSMDFHHRRCPACQGGAEGRAIPA